MICIILADGFEEMEAVVPIDLLRRAGREAVTASISNSLDVVGSHGIPVRADVLLAELDPEKIEMTVLPGGMGALHSMQKSAPLAGFLRKTYAAGRLVAAICAAPTYLAELGLLDGIHAVCYPGMQDKLGAASFCADEAVVRDGRIVTAQAAGSATEFGLKLIEVLDGWESMEKVRKAICFTSHIKGLD